jgi:N-acetylglutamate synthase-like GNAT family acetyltransferase
VRGTERTNLPAIRSARIADVDAVATVVRDAYAVYVARIGRQPAPATADYRQLIADGLVWVAETATEIVGVLVLRPQKQALLLENVAVAPSHQRRGIGRRLIAYAEQRARELGLSAIELYTNEQMTENLQLYPSLGYSETGRRIEDGFARVFFEKRLT